MPIFKGFHITYTCDRLKDILGNNRGFSVQLYLTPNNSGVCSSYVYGGAWVSKSLYILKILSILFSIYDWH
jgi:hypothetical protein